MDESYLLKLEEIEEHVNEFAAILGDNFVKNVLEAKYKMNFIDQPVNAHPYVECWNALKASLEKSKEEGKFSFSGKALESLNIITLLNTLRKIKNWERIYEDFVKTDTYHSAVHEARIACQYYRHGCNVEILNESDISGEKTPDILINFGNEKIYIECKSICAVSSTEKLAQWELMELIKKDLKRLKINGYLNVYFDEIFTLSMVGEVRKSVLSIMNQHSSYSGYINGQSVKIEFQKLGNKGEDIEAGGAIKLEYMPEVSYCSMIVNPKTSDKITLQEMIWINVFPFSEHNISKQINGAFKTARKQLKNKEKGLVYIELPYGNTKAFLNIVNRCYKNIFFRLQNDTKSVNAIVLTRNSAYVTDRLNSKNLQFVIPHMNPKYEMPDSFIYPSFKKFEHGKITERGKMEICIRKEHALGAGEISFIMNESDKEGRNQFKLIITDENTFQIELFNEIYGRFILKTSAVEFLDGKNLLKFFWDGKFFKARFNEQEIANSTQPSLFN